MDNPTGRVASVSDDAGSAVINVEPSVVCQRCAAGQGCGAGLLGQSSGERQITAVLPAGLTLKAGDSVRIMLHPSNIFRAAAVVYGIPLLSAVGGALLAWRLSLSDIAAAVSALAGIAAGILIARRYLAKQHCLRQFTPQVLERLSEFEVRSTPV